MANSARIDELRKKFDENPRRYFAPLANEYRKSGDLAQAVFILEEYLPQQQGHISGHIVYGQTLFELGRDEEAKRVFETALSLDPENLIALRHLGHISRQAGDFDAARSWYQRLLEADPRDAEIEQLLGSLDAAAQAHAAGLAGPPAVEAAPPAPLPEVDDSPLQVEHLVQQDAPGAPTREATHPLAPPPPSYAEPPKAAARAAEPPPSPVPASEPPQGEAEDELLDLNDFSFDLPSASAQTPAADAADESEAVAATADEHEDAPPKEDAPEPVAEESAAPRRAERPPPDVPLGFEPFSGLDSAAAASESANVSGLESYEFESPAGPVTEVSDDVGSFYMEPPSSASEAETETVEPAQGFESIDMEFAEEVVAEDATPESTAQIDDVQEPEPAEPIEEVEAGDAAVRATMPIASTPVTAAPVVESPATPTPKESIPVASTPVALAPASPTPASPWVASTPVASTPVASTPVASTPISSTTPGVDEPTVHASSDTDDESDAFATETMAKLYLSQGHLESALGIYRTLAAKRPDDELLQRQVAEIEDRVQRRRREPTPSAAIDASAVDASDDEVSDSTAAARIGPTIRDFLVGIIRRGSAPEAGDVPPPPNGGTIDQLFSAGMEDEGALDDDLAAADTLAQAFAPELPSPRDPMRGNPAREASTELSLDRVFRQPTPAHAGEASAAGFSFDQFFSGERSDDSEPSAPDAPGDPHDIEQFNAWLNGLKKS